MAVVEERRGNEAEFARAWVECRSEVLRATTRSFPAAGSVSIEAAVDRAWTELYEEGQAGPGALPGRWKTLAYLRALNGVRERHRHPVSLIPVGELDENGALGDSGAEEIEALRAEARAQEIVQQVSGDARRWLETVLDAPSAPPRDLARTLGWAPEKLKSVARRTRPRLREFVSARATGVICERRQAVMEAFAATHLARRTPALAVRLQGRQTLGPERYEQVALHIAGCEECEQAWHSVQNRLLRPRLVLIPIGLAGKLAAAGASAAASGRGLLGRLDRLLSDLRLRVGSSVARATAGGAAGTAGTAGALAGKGVAVCVGVLCATGVGTAALVGLPTGIIASRAVSHHHHRTVAAQRGQGDHRSPAAATVLGAADSQASAAQSATSSTRAEQNSPRTGTAHTISRPTHPVTPGSLIATSSATNTNEATSQPSARAASTSGSASQSGVSTEYVPSAASSSSQSTSSSSAKHGPCVPGSLSC